MSVNDSAHEKSQDNDQRERQISWVSATDVGTYAYCGRLFWLTKVKGKKVDQEAEARLATGHDVHEAHGQQVNKAQIAKRHVADAMLWSAVGLLIMWLATRFGLSGNSLWIDAGLAGAVIGLAAALSYIARGRKLFRQTRLPEKATVIVSDTAAKRGKTLRDPLSGLYGRPDYILEEEGKLVPVELKPTKTTTRLYNSDEMQLVHYLMLLEQLEPKKFAGFGRVVYGQSVFKIDLTSERRGALLELVANIRKSREGETEVNRTHNIRGRCTGCAVKEQCSQALKPKAPVKSKNEQKTNQSPAGYQIRGADRRQAPDE